MGKRRLLARLSRLVIPLLSLSGTCVGCQPWTVVRCQSWKMRRGKKKKRIGKASALPQLKGNTVLLKNEQNKHCALYTSVIIRPFYKNFWGILFTEGASHSIQPVLFVKTNVVALPSTYFYLWNLFNWLFSSLLPSAYSQSAVNGSANCQKAGIARSELRSSCRIKLKTFLNRISSST